MGDIDPKETLTAKCYGCGQTNFMVHDSPDPPVEFIIKFFERRSEVMRTYPTLEEGPGLNPV